MDSNLLSDDEKMRLKTNRRILIVDDEPFNLLGLQIVLSQCGIIDIKNMIDTANSGMLAMQLIKASYREREYGYGLIFMDCSMPIMDGYETTEKIRRFHK